MLLAALEKIVQGFEKLMKEENIKIFKNAEIKRILTKDEQAIGVKFKNKVVYANKIVMNTDPAYTYKYLIKSKNNKKWHQKRSIQMDYLMGLFVIYFGTKKSIQKLLIIPYGWERDTKVY